MFASDLGQLISSLGTTSIVVLLILVWFSVFSWGIIVYKWRMVRMIHEEEQQFLRAYEREAKFDDPDLPKLHRLAKQLSHSPSGSVFLGVVSRLEHLPDLRTTDVIDETSKQSGWPERRYLEQVIRYLVQEQITRQEAYLPFLATTGNITPFIGLLGTVVGVIHAFQRIGAEGTASIAAVAPGVSEALVATAAGLFAAIPAVVGYNYYLSRIRKITFGVEAFGIEFLNALEGMSPDVKEVEVLR